MAQVAARLRLLLSCAPASGMAQASTAAKSRRSIIQTSSRRTRSGDGRGLFLEFQPDLLVVAEGDRDLAAVLQPAEQQLVGQRAADGVLDQTRHRPRAHQRAIALHRTSAPTRRPES